MEAVDAVDSLLASPSSRLLAPGDRYLPLLRSLIAESHVQGTLAYDAQIAAVCLEHGATVLLTDNQDFAGFRSLKPLTRQMFLNR